MVFLYRLNLETKKQFSFIFTSFSLFGFDSKIYMMMMMTILGISFSRICSLLFSWLAANHIHIDSISKNFTIAIIKRIYLFCEHSMEIKKNIHRFQTNSFTKLIYLRYVIIVISSYSISVS